MYPLYFFRELRPQHSEYVKVISKNEQVFLRIKTSLLGEVPNGWEYTCQRISLDESQRKALETDFTPLEEARYMAAVLEVSGFFANVISKVPENFKPIQ